MSGCQEGEFTCNDGQCVSMEQRCDQLPHCRDTSDEIGCDILNLKNSYNRNIPPIRSINGSKVAVDVNTSIDIFKLVDINEEDYSIEIQHQISMVWKENRVTYQNLNLLECSYARGHPETLVAKGYLREHRSEGHH